MRNQNAGASLTQPGPILQFQGLFELVFDNPPAGDQSRYAVAGYLNQ